MTNVVYYITAGGENPVKKIPRIFAKTAKGQNF